MHPSRGLRMTAANAGGMAAAAPVILPAYSPHLQTTARDYESFSLSPLDRFLAVAVPAERQAPHELRRQAPRSVTDRRGAAVQSLPDLETLLEPGDGPTETLSELDFGPVAEQFTRLCDIGQGVRHVSRPGGQVFQRGRLSRYRLKLLDQLADREPGPAAYIEDLSGCARRVESQEVCLDDVVDIGKVPGL